MPKKRQDRGRVLVKGRHNRKYASDEAPGEFREKYHILTESLGIGSFQLSPAPSFSFLNADSRLAAMLGYPSPEALAGVRLQDLLINPVDAGQILEALESCGSVQNREALIRRRDGPEIWVSFCMWAKRSPHSPIEVINGFSHDVTEHRVFEMEMEFHESELNRYALALTQANKKLNLLSSITRHDLLNQLTSLSCYLELVRSEVTDKKLLEYLAIEEKVVDTIQKQIEFTRDYQDIGVQSPQWYNIEQTILNATSALEIQPGVLTVSTGSLSIYADPLIEKVFFNLVENAIRHGGGTDRIRFSFIRRPGGVVLLCEDNGPGVPDQYKEAIFNRKYFKHTGFGLFLSREILGITGITISETGEPGKGARFEICIPEGYYRTESP